MQKTEAVFPPKVRRNWGYWDAVADIQAGRRNREYIRAGEMFCLPKWDKPYRDGYAAGIQEERERRNA